MKSLRSWRFWVLIYLALLLASTIVRLVIKSEPDRIEPPGTHWITENTKTPNWFERDVSAANLASEMDPPEEDIWIASNRETALILELGKTHSPRGAILIDPLFLEETDALGDGFLNRASHSFRAIANTLIIYGFPHFGYLDRFPSWGIGNARFAAQTELEDYRHHFENWKIPTAFIETAPENSWIFQEHARLLPQAHHYRVTSPDEMLAVLTKLSEEGITTRVPNKAELNYATAPPQHRAKTGLALTGLMVLLALSTLISEDLACIGGGILAARGVIDFLPATFACFAGIFLGDIFLYLMGRWLGKPALRKVPLKWFVNADAVESSERFFAQHGPKLIFTSRFVPGTRLPTYVASGVLGMPLRTFLLYFLFASLLWTPILVGLATLIGGPLVSLFETYEHWALPGLIGAVLALYILVELIIPLFSYRGRRLLLGAWRRRTRWEFWPMWAFYPPILIYLLWLGIKHRSLTLFTAVNPGIPASGVAMESKSAILTGLGGGEDAHPHLGRFLLLQKDLAPEDKVDRVTKFMDAQNLEYPLVLKPDVGERGAGVAIAESAEEAAAYLKRCPVDAIAQEFLPGNEFGVFYYRFPNEENGRILSITEKQSVSIVGNGKDTVERLILDHPRAICQAPFFFKKHLAVLTNVLAEEETLNLSPLGTHSRGALFLDGVDCITPALEAKIDALSKHYEGFYFGRFDLKATDKKALSETATFKIIELNGVTSECTHIYDPKHGLIHAYQTLFKQWRIAFEIARQNRDKGAQTLTISELRKLLSTFYAKEPFEA